MARKKKEPEIERDEPVEDAFIVKKHSLAEWQIIDVRIKGDKVIFRKEREPDVAAIVAKKLMFEIGRKGT